MVQGNPIDRSGGAGVQVGGGSAATIIDNTIDRSGQYGINVFES